MLIVFKCLVYNRPLFLFYCFLDVSVINQPAMCPLAALSSLSKHLKHSGVHE